MDCNEELVATGDLLRKRQLQLNEQLRHTFAELSQNAELQDQHRELREQIMAHGRAVRASVEAQDAADAALRRGDTDAARSLMEEAESSLPADLPATPAEPDKAEPVRDDVPQPASPPEEPVVKTPEEPAETPEPPAPSAPDSSGMEERIKAHFDQGLGAIREQVEAVALPDGYREVLDRYSPEDLEMALKAGRWVNDRRWTPKDKKSKSSHNNGVAEDGAPN